MAQTNSDGDTLGDSCDNCPATANQDQANTDGDGQGNACDNCPSVSTPWVVAPGDTDRDAFTDTQETFIGTNPAIWCGTNTWPLDFDNNHTINVLDLSFFVGTVGSSSPGPPYSQRLDFDGSHTINVLDPSFFVGVVGKSCTP